MNDLISIVVPVYNVEQYLNDCIVSLLNQTYSKIEVILVDDGSRDQSGVICDSYKIMDNRIKVIHKANGGLSDARNSGMNASAGKYITFVDSDDVVDEHFIEQLYENIIRYGVDISFCDYISFKALDIKLNEKISRPNCLELSSHDCLKQVYTKKRHGFEFVTWGKLYKKSLFDENNIEFPTGKIHEDIYTTYKLIYYSRKVIFVDFQGYFYRKRDNSIMNEPFNVNHLVAINATHEACEFFDGAHDIDLLTYAVSFHLNVCLNNYLKLVNARKTVNNFADYKKWIKNEINFGLTYRVLPWYIYLYYKLVELSMNSFLIKLKILYDK